MADYSVIKNLFSGLSSVPEEEWNRFSPSLSTKTVAKGKTWVKAGGPGGEIGFVLRGLLRIYYVTHEGMEFTRTFRCEGQFVASYSAALTGHPSDVTIEAIEPTELITFRYEDFKKGYGRHACWQEIGRKMGELQYITYEKRSYELACLSAEKRYARFRADHAHLSNRLSQTQIASYLGITPVSLSRLLGRKVRAKARDSRGK